MQPVLEVRRLFHRYGDTIALDEVDLDVGTGEIVALLGPNGAGKSTLVGVVTALLRRQRGHVRVMGADPTRAATRRRMGVVLQTIGLPRTLTVGELVIGAAQRAGMDASAAGPIVTELGLTTLADRPAHKLSGGQGQRLQLAMALVGEPDLLVLDEPTVGLDINARREFWARLDQRRAAGTGILLTTHLIEESAAVADRVVVLAGGRVADQGTPSELTARLPDRTITVSTSVDDADVAALPDVAEVVRRGDHLRIATTQPEALLQRLFTLDPDLSDLRIEGASLEDAVASLSPTTVSTTEPARKVAA